MSLLDEAKRIRAALSFEGLTNQIAQYTARHDSFVAQKESLTEQQLNAVHPNAPAGDTTTVREVLDMNIADAQKVLDAAQVNMESLKASLEADPIFTDSDTMEVEAKISQTKGAIASLKRV